MSTLVRTEEEVTSKGPLNQFAAQIPKELIAIANIKQPNHRIQVSGQTKLPLKLLTPLIKAQ